MQYVTITAQMLRCWPEHRVLGRHYRFLDYIHHGPSEELRRRHVWPACSLYDEDVERPWLKV